MDKKSSRSSGVAQRLFATERRRSAVDLGSEKVVAFERGRSKTVRCRAAPVWSRFGIFAATGVIISGSLGAVGLELGLLVFLQLFVAVGGVIAAVGVVQQQPQLLRQC